MLRLSLNDRLGFSQSSVLLLILLIGIAVIDAHASAEEKPDYPCVVSVDKARKAWKEEGALILDVRQPGAYRGNHIPGSINLPRHTIKYKQGVP